MLVNWEARTIVADNQVSRSTFSWWAAMVEVGADEVVVVAVGPV